MDVADMTGKTVVITGGNSGIGLETAVALAQAGAKTLITVRDTARGQAAVADIWARSGSNDVDVVVFDLGSIASTRQGAADILARCDRIDVLVNNAGVVLSSRLETEDGLEATFAINHLGPFVLTELLLDRIKSSAPARIVNVASTAHKGARKGLNFDDLQSTSAYGGMQVYSKSKLANIYFTSELARRLEGTGVTVNCFAPRHRRYRVRPRWRRLRCARLRAQGDQALHPQRRPGGPHLGLPGIVSRRRRRDGTLFREVQAPHSVRRGPRRRGGQEIVDGQRGDRGPEGVSSARFTHVRTQEVLADFVGCA